MAFSKLFINSSEFSNSDLCRAKTFPGGWGNGAELVVLRPSSGFLCDLWQALVSPSVQEECSQETSGFPGMAKALLVGGTLSSL